MKRFACILVLCASFAAAQSQQTERVKPVEVTVAAGDVPILPARVWAECADGTGEWRQVRWENFRTGTEAQHLEQPAGTEYYVAGHVLGKGSDPLGMPITARVSVTATRKDAPRMAAHPLPLCDVRLTGENTLTRNRERDIEHLLSLDLSEQLYNYHDTYGLPTEGMKVSTGWDGPTIKLKGHGVGHYLSALALAYSSLSAEDARRAQLLERIRTIVQTMRVCQERTFVWSDSLGRYFEARDLLPGEELAKAGGEWKDFDRYKQDWQHYGYGYINAIPAQHLALIEAYRPYNNEKWVWAPYYTVHKQLAGLMEVAQLVQDTAVAHQALQVATDMGRWIHNRLSSRTTAEQRARMWNIYIGGEVGGMQEVLSRIQQASGAEWDAASMFDAPMFYTPLSHGIDSIRNRHANQHIPMIIGALRLYGVSGNDYYYRIAENFWNLLQGRYVYATGGVGDGERFREPYQQMQRLVAEENVNETCCAYNLAKLTRDLNQYHPNDARLMDYYERLLCNQIVGSLSPDRWAVTYHYGIGMNMAKPFGNETPQETCCGGTGCENHVKYPEAAYFVGGDTLWVGQYMPTEALWREKGVIIRQECSWPAEQTVLSFASQAGKTCAFTLKVRVPYWATSGYEVLLNGKPLKVKAMPQSYVEIPRRRWQETDRLEIRMPFVRHMEYGPDLIDGSRVAAVMQGPLVLTTSDITSWRHEPRTEEQISSMHFVPDFQRKDKCTHYFKVAVTK